MQQKGYGEKKKYHINVLFITEKNFISYRYKLFWIALLLHKHKEHEWPYKSKKVFSSAMTGIECIGKNRIVSDKYFPNLLLLLLHGLLELHTVPMHLINLGGFIFHGLIPDLYKYSTCMTAFDEEFHRSVTHQPFVSLL